MCSTAALDVLMLSWFDLLLWFTSHTHMHRDMTCTGTEAGDWSAAAVVPLLLYCCRTAVCWFCGCQAERLLFCENNPPRFLIILCAGDSTHTTRIYTEVQTHIHIHRATVCGYRKGVLLLLLALLLRSRQQTGWNNCTGVRRAGKRSEYIIKHREGSGLSGWGRGGGS